MGFTTSRTVLGKTRDEAGAFPDLNLKLFAKLAHTVQRGKIVRSSEIIALYDVPVSANAIELVVHLDRSCSMMVA